MPAGSRGFQPRIPPNGSTVSAVPSAAFLRSLRSLLCSIRFLAYFLFIRASVASCENTPPRKNQRQIFRNTHRITKLLHFPRPVGRGSRRAFLALPLAIVAILSVPLLLLIRASVPTCKKILHSASLGRHSLRSDGACGLSAFLSAIARSAAADAGGSRRKFERFSPRPRRAPVQFWTRQASVALSALLRSTWPRAPN